MRQAVWRPREGRVTGAAYWQLTRYKCNRANTRPRGHPPAHLRRGLGAADLVGAPGGLHRGPDGLQRLWGPHTQGGAGFHAC